MMIYWKIQEIGHIAIESSFFYLHTGPTSPTFCIHKCSKKASKFSKISGTSHIFPCLQIRQSFLRGALDHTIAVHSQLQILWEWLVLCKAFSCNNVDNDLYTFDGIAWLGIVIGYNPDTSDTAKYI
jgi:hypothetical protein